MYHKSRFGQILENLPRSLIDTAVRQYDGERYDKSFRVRDHILVLLYAQYTNIPGLRGLTTAFNTQAHAHYHLDTQTVQRSTLSDANQRRNPEIFRYIAEQLMSRVKGQQRKELRELICLIDSTPIQLGGFGFDWTKQTATQRTRGLKMHVVIDGRHTTPQYLDITSPNINDITPAKHMPLEAGVTYVFDKGYYDYSWWHQIDQTSAWFVTRFKKHAAVTVIKSQITSGEYILKDELVCFKKGGHKNTYLNNPLRRITVYREGKSPLILATNDMQRSAEEIAALYKQRWQIELFFKWMKQHLKIKRFLGRSENAVLLQLYAAIIGYLLLWQYKEQHCPNADSLYLLLIEIRFTMMDSGTTAYHRSRRRWRKDRDFQIDRRQYVLPV